MHWDESVWIAQQLKQLVADQTTEIENYIHNQSTKTTLFFKTSTEQCQKPENGDVCFIIEEQVAATTQGQ